MASSTPLVGDAESVAPSRDLPGWRLTYIDDFNGSRLNARWFKYEGVPGGDPAGQFAGSHVTVSDGQLHIEGYRDARYGDKFTTGGVSSHALAQTYGKYVVRFRVNSGKGLSYAVLLWPENGSWPPEVNFAEDNGAPGRQTLTGTLHFRDGTGIHLMTHATYKIDMTQWHTLGVEWLPGSLTYTIDGKVWARMTGASVPRVPMRPALQTQAWYCGDSWETCPDHTTPARVTMDVDWIAVYKPA